MNFLGTALIWLKLGWPIAKATIDVVKDGKITKQEIFFAIEKAMGDREEIVLWKSKTVK